MKRWVGQIDANMEVPEIDTFINDIRAVCLRHGFCISHEDTHGAFKVVKYSDDAFDWLTFAHDYREDAI